MILQKGCVPSETLRELVKTGGNFFIKFGTLSCGPCIRMTDIFSKTDAHTLIDVELETCREYWPYVRQFPTWLYIENGKVTKGGIGFPLGAADPFKHVLDNNILAQPNDLIKFVSNLLDEG